MGVQVCKCVCGEVCSYDWGMNAIQVSKNMCIGSRSARLCAKIFEWVHGLGDL